MKLNRYITILFFSIIFSSIENVNAQSPNWLWAKSIGGTGNETCHGVSTDQAGNVYSLGSFEGTADFDPGTGTYNLTSAGILDIYVTKFDPSGNFIWAINIGDVGSDVAYAISANFDGSFYITGRYKDTIDFDPSPNISTLTSVGNYDAFVAKYTSSGNFIWAKSLGGSGDDEGFSVSLDSAGNVYVAGYFADTADFDPGASVRNLISNGGYDAFICKLSFNGVFLWANSVGSILFDSGVDVTVDGIGNVYITGTFNGTVDLNPGASVANFTSAGGNDIFVLRLSPAGNYITAYGMGGNQTEIPAALDANQGGDIYTTGSYRGTADFNSGPGINNLTSNGDYDIFISKFDDLGNFNWAQSSGGTLVDNSYDIAVDKYGSIYTTGFFRGTVDFNPGAATFNMTSLGGNDAFISKLDSSGNFIWAKSIGALYSEIGFSLAFDSLNNLIIAGHYMSSLVNFGSITLANNVTGGITSDVFIAKLDSGITSSGVGLENLFNTNTFTLYPNPTNELFVISYPTFSNKSVTITISDVTGKIIYNSTTESADKLIVKTNDFSNGIYFVNVQSTGYNETKKLSIVK